MTDELIFADESSPPEQSGGDEDVGAWKILIVDDQKDIHTVTRMVLQDFAFEGRKVSCMSVYSGEEAMKAIVDYPDIAVMLLDVVMETKQAGLDVARFIRSEAKNRFVRIILRTGQPGEAPEREVVTDLDINDYREKTELTADKLVTAVTTAIRSYRDLMLINESHRGLHLLAMSVAHQVRNRTVAIAGFANLIKRKEGCSLEMADHIETILSESTRLEGMVSDVTRYAAIELGAVVPASIRDLLEEAMDAVDQGTQGNEGVEWEVFCPDQTVLVDPVLFVKAFKAIMQNCVDFSDGRPHVKVSVSPGRLACVIEVADNGSGIREDDLPHVFDPFFSLKPEGSGMGLSIVQKVAMGHQWDLSVDSTPSKGTMVRVVIPRRELTG